MIVSRSLSSDMALKAPVCVRACARKVIGFRPDATRPMPGGKCRMVEPQRGDLSPGRRVLSDGSQSVSLMQVDNYLE